MNAIGTDIRNMSFEQQRAECIKELIDSGVKANIAMDVVEDLDRLKDEFWDDLNPVIVDYVFALQEKIESKVKKINSKSELTHIDGSPLEQEVQFSSNQAIKAEKYAHTDYLTAMGINPDENTYSVINRVSILQDSDNLDELVHRMVYMPERKEKEDRAHGAMRGFLRGKAYQKANNDIPEDIDFDDFKMEIVKDAMVEVKKLQSTYNEDPEVKNFLYTPEGMVSALSGFIDYTYNGG